MRKLFFLVLGLISLQAVAQAPVVTKTEVNTLINAKLTNYVKPSDIKVVARKLSDFAGQGDSLARTKEPFIAPSSSSYYFNGHKQFVPFPAIPTNSTFVDRSTDQLIGGEKTNTGPWRFANTYKNQLFVGGGGQGGWLNLVNGVNNGTTAGLGYLSSSSLELLVNNDEAGLTLRFPDGQSRFNDAGGLTVGSTANNGFKLDVYGTSNFRGNVSVAVGGNISGDGSGISNIPYSAISNPPSIPADNLLVHLAGTETITGAKNFTTNPTFNGSQLVNIGGTQTLTSKTMSGTNNTFSNIPYTALTGTPAIPTNANFVDVLTPQNVPFVKSFTDTWANYQLKAGSTNQAGVIGFVNGAGVVNGSIGYSSAMSGGDLRINSNSTFGLDISGSRKMQIYPDGNVAIQNGGTYTSSGHLFQINGTSNHTGTANFRANHGNFQADFGQINEGARVSFRSGLGGATSGVLGFETSVSDEFQFRAGSASAFVNGGVRSLSIMSDGNIIAQTGGTPVNAGYKFDVIGTTRLSGATTTQSIQPVTDNAYSLGLNGARWGNVFANSYSSSGSTGGINFTETTGFTNVFARFQPVTHNLVLQSSGSIPTETGAGLQLNHSISPVSGTGRAMSITSTVTATANNDVLLGLDINPTFNAGAFTGVSNGALRVQGDSYMQTISPRFGSSFNLGTFATRWNNTYSNNFWGDAFVGTNSNTYFGSTGANAVHIRQGGTTNLVAGFFSDGKAYFQNSLAAPNNNGSGLQVSHDLTAAAGKAWGQTFTPILRASANNDELIGTVIAPALITGAFTGVTPYALRVGSAMKMDGQIDQGGHIIPQTDNLYNLGSSSRRFGTIFGTTITSGTFLNSSGTTTFGSSSSSSAINFRQGSTGQLVAGFFNDGNMYIQPRGGLPANDGYNLQVGGHMRVSGEFFNEPVSGAGFKTSDLLGTAGGIGFHGNDGNVATEGNLFLGHNALDGHTYVNAPTDISLNVNMSPKVLVKSNRIDFGAAINLGVVPEYADNAAAIAGGKFVGDVYRTGDILKIVH